MEAPVRSEPTTPESGEEILVSLATLDAGLRKGDTELGEFHVELEGVGRSLDGRSTPA